MEDYDIFNEMHLKNKKVVMIVENDENLFFEISPFCDVMPLRFSYDISNFSNQYVERTKSLFSYYYNINNSYKNELLRLKKHFIHYQRYPFMLYISKKNANYKIIKEICEDLHIECVTNKRLFIKKVKNDKKVFLIDSDGTLKNSNGIISTKNKDAIKQIKDSGDYAIICTARPRYHTIEVMKESKASNSIISFNGGEIYDLDNKRIVKSFFINKNVTYKIIDDCFKLDIRAVISAEKFDFVTKEIRNESQHLLNKTNYIEQLKKYKIQTIMIIDEKKELVNKYKEKLKKSNTITIINEKSKSDDYYEEWFVIGNKNSNKGVAAKNISNYLGVPLYNIISIGNDYNDLPMFKVSGKSFAVNNSDIEVKMNADYIVSSNEEDPIMDVVNVIYR